MLQSCQCNRAIRASKFTPHFCRASYVNMIIIRWPMDPRQSFLPRRGHKITLLHLHFFSVTTAGLAGADVGQWSRFSCHHSSCVTAAWAWHSVLWSYRQLLDVTFATFAACAFAWAASFLLLWLLCFTPLSWTVVVSKGLPCWDVTSSVHLQSVQRCRLFLLSYLIPRRVLHAATRRWLSTGSLAAAKVLD